MLKERLSPIDSLFLPNFVPIEFLLFFNYRIDSEKLRKAAETIEDIFWPAFSTISKGEISHKKDAFTINEKTENEPLPSTNSRTLLTKKYTDNKFIDKEPLLSIRIIQHKDGSLIIPKLNHAVGDAFSYLLLLKNLSNSYKENTYKETNRKSRYHLTSEKPPIKHSRNLIDFNLAKDIRETTSRKEETGFHIKEISIQKLKEISSSALKKYGTHITENDILTAYSAKSIVKLTPLHFGKHICITTPVDIRRIIPDVGVNFFGNGLAFIESEITKDIILGCPIDFISAKIRQSKPAITEIWYRAYLKDLSKKLHSSPLPLRPYNSDTGILTTNLSKIDFSRIDFGLGPPRTILPITCHQNLSIITKGSESYFININI